MARRKHALGPETFKKFVQDLREHSKAVCGLDGRLQPLSEDATSFQGPVKACQAR